MYADELVLYKDFENGGILFDFARLMDEDIYGEDARELIGRAFGKLIELSENLGFKGNVWHNYITYLIANNENAYSRACEIRGEVNGSINSIAVHDFYILKKLFDYAIADDRKDRLCDYKI